MKLIDADALLNRLNKVLTDSDMQFMWHAGFTACMRIVRHAPAIDPVKHGRWVVSEDGLMECSGCKWLFSYQPGLEQEWNYCPNCGARMDGDEGDC